MKQTRQKRSRASESVKSSERVGAKAQIRLAVKQVQQADSWEDQLRAAALADGRSVYALALAAYGTRAKQAQLGRFLSGRGGITLGSAEQLGRALGFALVRQAD